jgi:transposase-like protein
MARASFFTPQKQGTFLSYLERGDTVKIAAEKAGISHVTVNKWVKDGLALTDNSEKAEFARKYRAIQTGEGATLTKDDFQVIREQCVRGERRLTPTQLKCIEQLEGRHEHEAKQLQDEEPKDTFSDELAAIRNLPTAGHEDDDPWSET